MHSLTHTHCSVTCVWVTYAQMDCGVQAALRLFIRVKDPCVVGLNKGAEAAAAETGPMWVVLHRDGKATPLKLGFRGVCVFWLTSVLWNIKCCSGNRWKNEASCSALVVNQMSITQRLPLSVLFHFLFVYFFYSLWKCHLPARSLKEVDRFLVVYLKTQLKACAHTEPPTWHIDYRPVQTVCVCELWPAAYGQKMTTMTEHKYIWTNVWVGALVWFRADVSRMSATHGGWNINFGPVLIYQWV